MENKTPSTDYLRNGMDIKTFMSTSGPDRNAFTLKQENRVRLIINRMSPLLFPHVPFSPLEPASNKFSHLDTRNQHFFIEIKSTQKSVDIYGYSIDKAKLERMMAQAYTSYMDNKIKKDVFLIVQCLKSFVHFNLYMFNLTKNFDLSSLIVSSFNESETKYPWNGKEKIYPDKRSSEALNKQVYKLMPSQAQTIYDNTYEMEKNEK